MGYVTPNRTRSSSLSSPRHWAVDWTVVECIKIFCGSRQDQRSGFSRYVGRDWEYWKGLLNCGRSEKVQTAFPATVPTQKGRRQEPRARKELYEVVLEECKAKLIDLCEQYCAEQGWRLPSDVVYRRNHKLASRKVDHLFAKIWDTEDLSSGEETNSDDQAMSSRYPTYEKGSPVTVDGLPRECKLIPFNSYCSRL